MRLLIEHHEQMGQGPERQAPFEHAGAAEEEPLADDQRDERDIHGIADVAIPAGHDEVLWRRDRRRGAEALQREAREGVEQDGESSGDQRYADPAEGRPAEQRRGHMPTVQQPRHVERNKARRDDQKERRAEDRAEAFHLGVRRCSSRCFAAGHSDATIENRTESRGIKSAAIRCPRKIPSHCPPMRWSAARERSLRTSVWKHTRTASQASNAWVSIMSFASVFAPVRTAERASHV